jgi:hypothetical protein
MEEKKKVLTVLTIIDRVRLKIILLSMLCLTGEDMGEIKKKKDKA